MGVLRHHTVLGKSGPKNWFGDGSDGDLHFAADHEFPSVQDGDMIVVNAKSLIIDAGVTVSVANRCRGLLVYVQEDCTINGTLSMTGRGCHANPADAGVSPDTPVAPSDGHAVPTDGIIIRRLAKGQSGTNIDVDLFHGCGQAAVDSELNQPVIVGAGIVVKIPRIGGAGATATIPDFGSGDGANGGILTDAPGGGGNGKVLNSSGSSFNLSATAGTCFSGGSGSGSGQIGPAPPSLYSEAYGGFGGDGFDVTASGTEYGGGGAGNPGGKGCNNVGANNPATDGENGTGGVLILIVGGSLTIGATGVIESNGKNGGGGVGDGGGGGSGGGFVFAAYAGALNNSGTLESTGGIGGTDLRGKGGNGGDGSVVGPIKIDQA